MNCNGGKISGQKIRTRILACIGDIKSGTAEMIMQAQWWKKKNTPEVQCDVAYVHGVVIEDIKLYVMHRKDGGLEERTRPFSHKWLFAPRA